MAFSALGGALQLGVTHSTAYYGDYGQTAYEHSQIENGSNPHKTTANNINLNVPISALSGSKLDVESTLYGVNTALGTKADKVASAVSGHLAGLDGNGNLTDSGVVASNVIEKVATATGLLKDDGSVDLTNYQPETLSLPIDTLGGTMLTVESTLNEFNTEIKSIDSDLDDKLSYVDNGILGAKNLLPVTSTSQTVNGVVFTVNSDGSITADGTASDNIIYLIHRQLISDGDESFFGKEVILSGCPNGGTVTTYYLECWINSSPQVWNRDFGDGVTFTMPNDNTTNWNVNISIKKDTVVNNLTFYPMVRISTDTDNTYRPYTKTNYQLTKKISNKMTYEDNSVLGAHNFNADLQSKVFVRGTGTGATAPNRVYSFKIGTGFKTGEQYKLAFDIKNSANFATSNGIGFRFSGQVGGSPAISGDIGFAHDNGHYSGVFTVTADSDSVYLYAYMSQSETDPTATLTVDNLVVCLSDDIDAYTPYAETNYQLTQNKMSYKDNSILGAKNLLNVNGLPVSYPSATSTGITTTINANGSITVNGTASADHDIVIGTTGDRLQISDYPSPIMVSKGSDVDKSILLMQVWYYDSTGTYTNHFQNEGTENANEFVLKPQSGDVQFAINFRVLSGGTVNNVTVYPMLRLASDNDSTWQPYSMTNQQLTNSVSVIPAPSSSNTETTVVQAITGASNTTANPPSAYAMQQWSNRLTKRFIYTGTIASGATGIGTWDASATPTETDWWQDDGFKIPDSANSTDIDVVFMFDPQAANGDVLTLGGYILDTTTGSLCIKFASPAKVATHKVAVDITYTRNYVN